MNNTENTTPEQTLQTAEQKCANSTTQPKADSTQNSNIFIDTLKQVMDKSLSVTKGSIFGFVALISIFLQGCFTTSVPTPESAYVKSQRVGRAAGLVINNMHLDTVKYNSVVRMLDNLSENIPSTNETFVTTWNKVATKFINQEIEKKHITALDSVVIMSVFSIVIQGIDFIVTKRIPQINDYHSISIAITQGFINGVKNVMVSPSATLGNATEVEYDKEAFEYLR